MATVQEVYDLFCDDVLEPGGLVLEIITEAQFLNILNEVILDFMKKTALIKRIYTQSVFAGVRQYSIPEDIMRVDDVFLAGRYLEKSDAATMSCADRNWRRTLVQIPQWWHEDGLPIKTVEIAPGPAYTGSYIIGPDEPNPPHAQYDTFTAIVDVAGSDVVQNARTHRGLTVIGPQKPGLVTGLDSEIPLIPDDLALAYLGFGVGERVFSGDNELQDQQRALYCGAQYREGIALCRAITGEVDEGEGQ